jgi:uncharacterized damage-inducible protein DinB
MFTDTLKAFFSRDLAKLKAEIELYPSEDLLWHVEKGISNSAGNLCLHLMGNLNFFIGATLGQTGYVRDRPLEFSQKNVPRATLIAQIEAATIMVNDTLSCLSAEDLQKEYPVVVFEQKMTTEFFLVHLTTHLTYHLGQINYHRRLL